MPRALPIAVLSILALAGCGPTAWEDRAQAWNATPHPEGAKFNLIDGNYKGVAELVSATGEDCPAGGAGTLSIGDGRIIYPYTPRITFVAPIGPNGALRAVSGPATLEGRIGDGNLNFAVRTPTCESRYALRWNK